MGGTAGVVLEKRADGLFYVGLTDGERDTIIFYTESFAAAQDCATELKHWIEDLRRRRDRPWSLHEIPRIRQGRLLS